MDTPIAALEAALYDTNQPDLRRTIGLVTYALIPVAVVEAVLADAANMTEDAEQPETEIDPAEDVPQIGAIAAFPVPVDTEVAVPSDQDFDISDPETEIDPAEDVVDVLSDVDFDITNPEAVTAQEEV